MPGDPCLSAQALSSSLYMKLLLSFKILTCIAGMCLIVCNLKRNGLQWLGHVNAKCIFLVHLLFSFLVAAGFCTIHTLDLIRLSQSHDNPCDYRVPVSLSFSVRLPCQVFIYMQVLTMFVLAVERTLAVYYLRSYERVSSPGFGMTCIVLVLVFSMAFPLLLLLPNVDLTKSYSGFVTKTAENASKFEVVILFQLIPQFCTLVLFHLVRHLSKNSTATDLGSRYQIEENRRVCHHLLPVFYTHAVILICSAGGISLIPVVLVGLNDVTFAAALETTGWTPLYASLMPVIVHLRHMYRRRKEKERAALGMKSVFLSIDSPPMSDTSSRGRTPPSLSWMRSNRVGNKG